MRLRLPAGDVEEIVADSVVSVMKDRDRLTALLEPSQRSPDTIRAIFDQANMLRERLRRESVNEHADVLRTVLARVTVMSNRSSTA